MKHGLAVSIRHADLADAERIVNWRNLPEIVRLSQSQRLIAMEEHLKWFSEALASPNHCILVIVANGEEVGLIRFEKEPACCTATIYLVPGHEGRGIGSSAFRLALAEAERTLSCRFFEAHIREENQASIRFFEKFGFSPVRSRQGMKIYQYEKKESV